MKKTGRNDPCVCGSGKKFKKCCESKMLGGRFMATKVDTASAVQIKKVASLSTLFNARLAETPKKPLPPPQEETVIPAQVEAIVTAEESKAESALIPQS